MDTLLLPRPDLFAHREALRLPASKVVESIRQSNAPVFV
jgi:hypothetical protein